MPTAVNTPQSRCRMGGARCDITPPVGIYHRMWGAATHDAATGIHRPLTATALVFQSLTGEPTDDTEQVLLAIDHCILWHREMDYILDCVAEGAGVPRERVIVTFSHTHSAGLMDIERAGLPGGSLIQPYLEELGARLATLVRQARETVQPVTIVYGAGRCNLAGQRDFRDEQSGQFVCGLNPDAPADDTLLVARITDEASNMLATIVNYACHPTTLAWTNTLISPDYPGAMREVVEGATGAPCVFLQGASGDLGPKEGYVGDTAVADRNGRILGHAALAALTALPAAGTRFEYIGPVVSGATLGSWAHRPLNEQELAPLAFFRVRRFNVDLAKRPELTTPQQTIADRDAWREKETQAHALGDAAAARDARAMTERNDRQLLRLAALPPGGTFALPVTICQMGDAFWVTVEAEPYNVLQRALRGRFPGVPIIVSVLANGARATYLPPAGVYGKGIYQESIAMLAAGSLEKLIDAISTQLAACQRESQGIRPLPAEPEDWLPAIEESEELVAAETTTALQGFPEGRVD